MSWQSYIYPQTLATFSSDYNKDIRIVQTFGKLKLLVNGSVQSGAYIESLWQKVFRVFHINDSIQVRDILIFGVAGGSIIHILKKVYPDAKITAVDIDQKMIEIGKIFFGLSSISRLTCVTSDVRKFIQSSAKRNSHYDLIIVDLFIGRHPVTFVGSSTFLLQLKFLLRPSGFLIINYLREHEYRQKSEILHKRLISIFTTVRDKGLFLNRFFCVTK